MRLRSIHCSKRSGLAPILLVALGWSFAVFNGDCATKRKKTTMSIEDAKKQVTERLETFRKTGEMGELRKAANLIEQIDAVGAPTFEDRHAARTAKLSLWLTLLDTIDSAKDPQFDPADVPAARVTVPPGTPMKPGVLVESPEGIANPADRQKYDDAVKANSEKTRRYRFQKELRQLDSELSARADAYIAGAQLKSPQNLKEMNAAIAAHVHNEERAAHLRALVTPQ
jgi:hypothetical protein